MNPDWHGIPVGGMYYSSFNLVNKHPELKPEDHYKQWARYGLDREDMLVVYPQMLYVDPLIGDVSEDYIKDYITRHS